MKELKKLWSLGSFKTMEERDYARAFILNSQNEVLFLKKNGAQKIAPNKWVLPGGAVERDETYEDALVRELFEEVNFKITNLKFLGTDERIIEKTHWKGFLYQAFGNIEDIFNKESEKHEDINWFSIEQIKHTLSAGEFKAFTLCETTS